MTKCAKTYLEIKMISFACVFRSILLQVQTTVNAHDQGLPLFSAKGVGPEMLRDYLGKLLGRE